MKKKLTIENNMLLVIGIAAAIVIVIGLVAIISWQHKPQLDAEPIVNIESDPLIEQQVVFDDYNVLITAKSLTVSEDGVRLRLLVENNRDQTITIPSIDLSALNGIMVDASINCTVDAHKKMHREMLFDSSQIKNARIENIKTIQFQFNLLEQTEAGTKSLYTTAPISIKTTVDPDLVQNKSFEGTELVNERDLRFVLHATDSVRHAALFAVYNNTAENVEINAAIVSIDGEPCENVAINSTTIGTGMVRLIEVEVPNNIVAMSAMSSYELQFDVTSPSSDIAILSFSAILSI